MSPNVVWIGIQPLVNVVYYLSKYGALSHAFGPNADATEKTISAVIARMFLKLILCF
jgi:hypothetical protein